MRSICWLGIIFTFVHLLECRVDITNFKCESLNKNFAKIEYCYIKAINRSYKFISMKAKLFQLPIRNMEMKFALLRRDNGYKPYMYNFSLDGCEFLKNPKKYPIANFFYLIIGDNTNFNHTCPFNHDFILEHLTLQQMEKRLEGWLPFPKGDYATRILWKTDNVLKFSTTVYGRIY